MSSDRDLIDYQQLMELLSSEFPEVIAAFSSYGKGLLHVEMGDFARQTEAAMDQGKFWQAERYFRFIDQVRKKAAPEVENAIDVSYVEFLALSEVTDNRLRGLKRMPDHLRRILLEIDGRGRWE